MIAAGLFGALPTREVAWISVVYAVLSVGMWLLPSAKAADQHAAAPRLSRTQWSACIGADIVCFGALHLLSQANSLNYAALLVLPVLMSGVLRPVASRPWRSLPWWRCFCSAMRGWA